MQQKNRGAKRAAVEPKGDAEARVDQSKSAEGNEARAEAPAAKPAGTPTRPKTPAFAQQGGRILLIALVVLALAAIAYRYMVVPQMTEQAAAPAAPAACSVICGTT